MKFLLTLLLLTLFVDASYIRAIRVTSFLDKDRAQTGLIQLKQFVKEHKNLNNFEKKLHFEYTIHKIEKHYLIVLEPLTDKAAVQEILDTLRVKYKKAYPRKLEAKPIISQKIEKKIAQLVSEPKFLPEQTEVRVIQVVPEPQVVPSQKVKSTSTPIKKLSEKKAPAVLHDNTPKIRDNSDINSSNEDISTLLIFILALLLIVSFFYIYFSRKKAKSTHSKTLTEIVIDNQDELKLTEQKVSITFEDDKDSEALMSNKFQIKPEELNTKVGLNSHNNELITYQNALKDFKEKHLDSAIVIERLCNNTHFDEALTLVRVLKEESIQIGAFNLHESIKTMEKEMELGENSQWEKSIWAYGITLKNLSTEIDHYLS